MKIPKYLRVNHFDLLNLWVSSLRDGLMPLYALFLVNNLGFNPVQIGWVMSASSASTLAAQMPLGFIYDRARRKGWPMTVASLIMLGGSVLIILNEKPSFPLILGVQILFGMSIAALTLGIPAISVATTDDEHLGDRLARNEIFGKTGNFVALGLAGALTSVYSLKIIFYIWAVLALLAAGFSAFTRPSKKPRQKRTRVSRSALTSSPTFLWLVIITSFMMLANTGALTIFEQSFAPKQPNGGASWITIATAVAQASVTLTIMGLARVQKCGALTAALGVTFGIVAVRLFTLSSGAFVYALVIGQALDGIIGGVLSAVPARLLAERHRSEFNVLAGALGAVGALGSMLSVFATGPLLNHLGFRGSLLAYLLPVLLGAVATVFAYRTLASHHCETK